MAQTLTELQLGKLFSNNDALCHKYITIYAYENVQKDKINNEILK